MPDHAPRSTAVDSMADERGADWPAQITGHIVGFVDQIKSKTTRPATLVVRGLVYGLVASLLGIAIAILLFIGLFRLVDRVRNLIIEDSVWLTYLVLGALFTLIGALLFASRKPRT
jgi:hypothetical protein